MKWYLIVLLLWISTREAQGSFHGNSLVNCAACQNVQVKDFTCQVNCELVKADGGRLN